MKIRILPSALKDLARGRRFYERQGEGLGNYFMNTLFSDIDSLALYGGIHLKVGSYHRLLFQTISVRDLLSDQRRGDRSLARVGLQARPAQNQTGTGMNRTNLLRAGYDSDLNIEGRHDPVLRDHDAAPPVEITRAPASRQAGQKLEQEGLRLAKRWLEQFVPRQVIPD